MIERDDDTLLSAIADQRDRDAFEALCARHSRRAYAIAFHFLRNAALAEDAVQEAMLAVWLSSDSYRAEHGKPEAWLMSIVVKKSLHLARSRKHSVRKESEDRPGVNRQSEDGSKRLENAEVAAALKQELERLPETDARLLTCCYGAGMTHRKIAEMLGMSQSTVTEKIQQALSRLRGRLSQAGVAAAVPLLEQQLSESISAAANYPPGIVAGILGRVDSAVGPAMKPSHRVRVVSKPAGFSAAGIGVVTAGCIALLGVGAWQFWNSSAQATTAAALQTPPKADSLYASWSFDRSAADFPVFGEWKWAPGSDKQPGAMVVAAPGIVGRIPLKVPRRPFVAVLTVRLGNGPSAVDSLWCDGDAFPEFEFWRNPGPYLKTGAMTFRVVFKDRYVMQFADRVPVGIRRFDRNYPFDQINVQLRNVSIEKIVVRDLLPEDETSDVRDPERLIAKFSAVPGSLRGKTAPLPFVSPLNAPDRTTR